MALLSVLTLGLASTASGLSFQGGGLVHSLEFKHKLRVCNAYPYSGALDVYRERDGESKKEKLTDSTASNGQGAMPYKACRDLATHLMSGDKLEFKVGDASAGSFSVSELPDNDAVLLLVCHRHDTVSTAMSFESHVFGNLENAQVAVIDTYKGKEKASPRIRDASDPKAKKPVRDEELQFDSVVAVNQGKYNIVLDNAMGKIMSKLPFVALNRESYVVMRTGVEAEQGETYKEELVVFPQSDASALPHSGSVRIGQVGILASILALATAFA